MKTTGPINKDIQARLRKIPSVDKALESIQIGALMELYPRNAVVESLRQALETLREHILAGESPGESEFSPSSLACITAQILEAEHQPSLRKAINASGVILHTGLGRAVLSARACEQLTEVATGHSLLELDPESGKRGSRQEHVESLLMKLTGCEAAMVVNNNAAAVFLAVNEMAENREVVVSRGQLVEIGGSFRIPDIIRRAGAKLVEVGTTNKTRISDYAGAVCFRESLLLYVHPSNFRITGFTEEVSVAELVELGQEYMIPVMVDLGSGAFVDFSRYGLTHEPTVQETISAGPDVVTFSGDKLIGGPQSGIILGRKEWLDRIRANPVARVVRIDKLSLAALESTLRTYIDGTAEAQIPVLRAISKPLSEIQVQAVELAESLRKLGLAVSVVDGCSEIGGGSLPGEMLPTILVTVQVPDLSADELAAKLRKQRPAILARITKDRLSLDPRTLLPGESDVIVEGFRNLSIKMMTDGLSRGVKDQ